MTEGPHSDGASPNGTGSQRTQREPRLLAIVWDTVQSASAKARRTLVLQVALLVLVTSYVVYDATDRTSPILWAVLFANLGTVVWMVVVGLHRMTQSSAQSCRAFEFGVGSHVMHQLLQALPAVSLVAVVLISIAMGLVLPLMAVEPVVVVIVATLMCLLFGILRTVSATTGFLYRHARDQADAAAAAREEVAGAQLQALQAQLQPHFLFNALNTVASLILTDTRAAESTVVHLAQVLRRTLDRTRAVLSTVEDEVDYLESYLAVERERFGERVRVEWAVDDEIRDLEIPTMTLQPLVENALKHGIGTRIEGGSLCVGGFVDAGRLTLFVTDDGVGFPKKLVEGTGLSNLRQRLLTLYGDQAELKIDRTGNGSRVEVSIPTSVTVTV